MTRNAYRFDIYGLFKLLTSHNDNNSKKDKATIWKEWWFPEAKNWLINLDMIWMFAIENFIACCSIFNIYSFLRYNEHCQSFVDPHNIETTASIIVCFRWFCSKSTGIHKRCMFRIKLMQLFSHKLILRIWKKIVGEILYTIHIVVKILQLIDKCACSNVNVHSKIICIPLSDKRVNFGRKLDVNQHC